MKSFKSSSYEYFFNETNSTATFSVLIKSCFSISGNVLFLCDKCLRCLVLVFFISPNGTSSPRTNSIKLCYWNMLLNHHRLQIIQTL